MKQYFQRHNVLPHYQFAFFNEIRNAKYCNVVFTLQGYIDAPSMTHKLLLQVMSTTEKVVQIYSY